MTTTNITVQASENWQDSGWDITTGVQISYVSGLWTCNPNPASGPAMYGPGGSNQTANKTGYPMDGEPEGCLLARVEGGNGTAGPFMVGVGAQILTPGRLWLVINDDLPGYHGAGLADNSGAVTMSLGLVGSGDALRFLFAGQTLAQCPVTPPAASLCWSRTNIHL
jgi:hypothetical protein